MKKITALLLAALLLVSAVACAEQSTGSQETTAAGTSGETEAATEPDPLDGLNYANADFRILTSTNDPGGVGNSNYLIEGPAEETGDVVDDSAYARNLTVEEKLGVKLVFTEVDLGYNDVANYINKLIATAEDAYEVIIEDLFPCAGLVLQGAFCDVLKGEYFDFTQNYWSYDCMMDLTIGYDSAYLMVGDFFIDTLRGSHALFFNKDLMTELGMDSSELYGTVLDGGWTLDELNTYISNSYADLNGDGNKNVGDRFGFVAMQIWGPSIPFVISGDPGFIERDENGIPSITVNNDRSVVLLDKLIEVFHGDSSLAMVGSSDLGDDAENIFRAGYSLFLGYQRLGSLEKFRDMDNDISLVPYPKLDENQKAYITSMHDTTEVGMIPITSAFTDMTSAVVEALCRETNKTVLPAYYETALKVKYTRDDEASQMIDIVHDNVGNAFALAYDASLNNILVKNTFYYGGLEKGTNNFASAYAKYEKSAQTALDKLIDNYNANNG